MPVTYQSATQVLKEVKETIFDKTNVTMNYSNYCQEQGLEPPIPEQYTDPKGGGKNQEEFNAFKAWADKPAVACGEIATFLDIRSRFNACPSNGDWEVIFLELGPVIDELNLSAALMSELKATYTEIENNQPQTRPRAGGVG